MQGSAGTLRLFFAIKPSTDQSAALVEQVAPLVTELHAQRVPPENLHATLCFLGAVAPEKLARLRDIAAGIRCRHATLRFDALEHWERAQVLCATAAESFAAAPARELAQQLAAECTAAGFSPDLKPFRAHLTLARKVHRQTAALGEWPRLLAPPLVVTCERFVLMQSQRGELGSIYSVVEDWALDMDELGDKSG